MRHAKAWLAALTGCVLAACAAAGEDSALSFDNGGKSDAPTNGDGGAAEPNAGNAVGNPTDNAIILVHAAAAGAYRLCFSQHLADQPTPTADLMPQANVVGVEVGSAARIDPLSAPGDIYFVPEGFARGASSCDYLLHNTPYGTKIGTIDADLLSGVHLLVVTGCQAKPSLGGESYDKAHCGDDYDDAKGNLGIEQIDLNGVYRDPNVLPTDIVQLSPGLEALAAGESVSIGYGPLGGPTDTEVPAPEFGVVTSFSTAPSLPDDAGLPVYGQLGFSVSVGHFGVIAQQSLAEIQQLSSPTDVPPTYYATASNYVLLMLGTPNVLPNGDDAGIADIRQALHFLAVPVVNPKPADAGADGGPGGDAGPVSDGG